MTLHVSTRPRKLVIPAFVLLVLILVALATWQFDRVSHQSENHQYHYSVDLSTTTTIENVTLVLPVPELNNTPMFIASLLNKTAYGVSPDWDLTVAEENGTPMLAIRAPRLVPKYHGYPIAIEPGTTVLPTPLVPGHEYSPDTPVLMPVTIAVMEMSGSVINTRSPVGNEPLFFPKGAFTPGSCVRPVCDGIAYDHPVPVYISYTAERPVVISLRVSIQGSNSVWRGGWLSNSYTDSVVIEVTGGRQGWIAGNGKLITAQGVFY